MVPLNQLAIRLVVMGGDQLVQPRMQAFKQVVVVGDQLVPLVRLVFRLAIVEVDLLVRPERLVVMLVRGDHVVKHGVHFQSEIDLPQEWEHSPPFVNVDNDLLKVFT